MSHRWSSLQLLVSDLQSSFAELDMRTLEGLLLGGTLVIVTALILIAVNRKKSQIGSF